MKKHIICFSGGHSSAIVALMVWQRYPNDTILLNHDINPAYEHGDIKRFKQEVADYMGLPITYANHYASREAAIVSTGEQFLTPTEAYEASRRIPSQFEVARKRRAFKKPGSGDAVCTAVLKTWPFMAYLAEHFPLGPDGKNHECVIYYGFDDEEQHRIARRTFILGEKGYATEYPLANWMPTIESTCELGIPRPATYSVFKHGNCIGCTKAGLLHWYVVYCLYPEVYAEGMEAEDDLGYSMMRQQKNGIKNSPVYLRELAPVFEQMKQMGIEPSEHAPRGPFLKALKYFQLQDVADAIACECHVA
jgi:hypothetical protein